LLSPIFISSLDKLYKLPEGMQFKSELNNSWYENNGNLYTNSLSKEEINIGESKEIELVLIIKF